MGEIKIELLVPNSNQNIWISMWSMDVLQPWLLKLKMEIKNLNDNSNCHPKPTSTKLIQNSSTRKKINKLFRSQFQKTSRLFNFQFQWKKITNKLFVILNILLRIFVIFQILNLPVKKIK